MNHTFCYSYGGDPIDYGLLFSGSPEGDEYKFAVRENIQPDMCKLKVYYATSKVTKMAEEPVYPSVFDLFINLGGALSLWMGLSFIMVVEVVEIIVDLFIGCLTPYTGGSGGHAKKRKQSNVKKQNEGWPEFVKG